MKILIISGFLGAGKTTFIKELVRRTRKDLVVLENEYGGGNLDGRQLEQELAGSGLNIWELTEGCVCCTMKDSFAASVLTIANSLDPEFLVVEPTGAAQLSKLIENIRRVEYENISLLQPLTLLDWQNYQIQREQFGEIWRDQLQNTGTILFSKVGGADREEIEALAVEVQMLAPGAACVTTDYTDLPDEWFQALLERKQDEADASPAVETEKAPESITLNGAALDNPDQMILFLTGVVSGVFGRVIRAKGCIPAGESWLRFDVVGNRYAITGADPQERASAVLIGSQLRRDWLRQVLLPVYPDFQPETIRERRKRIRPRMMVSR